MHEGNVFDQKLLEKSYFIFKMSGPAMVRQASSDFWTPLNMVTCTANIENSFI